MQPTQMGAALRTVGWVVVASLVIAALVAIRSILGGGFNSDDGRVIATSVGFGVFTATGSAGVVLRTRDPERLPLLSLGTMIVSGASFVFLLIALWGSNSDSDSVVRWFATTAIMALGGSFVCLTLAGSRPTDGPTVENLRSASIILAVAASMLAIGASAGLKANPDEGYWKLVAVVVILLLLATTLVPILRRLEHGRPAATPTAAPASIRVPSASSTTHTTAPLPFTTEVLATAARIEALTAGDDAVQQELARLRELARFYG
jgi:hypothetical protein